jgi:hypothetical protein
MSRFATDAPEKGAALSTETDAESSAVRVDALIAQLSSSDGAFGIRMATRGRSPHPLYPLRSGHAEPTGSRMRRS